MHLEAVLDKYAEKLTRRNHKVGIYRLCRLFISLMNIGVHFTVSLIAHKIYKLVALILISPGLVDYLLCIWTKSSCIIRKLCKIGLIAFVFRGEGACLLKGDEVPRSV